MTSRPSGERWARVLSLLDELLDLPDDRRSARLEAIGREDPEARVELERLLQVDRKVGDSLDRRFAAEAADLLDTLESDSMGEMIGRTLSHFRVLAKIGEGGMGVVYRAEDVRLHRPVALKVLPPHLLGDAERRLRFLREARTAAAVSHPNICHVYEVDEADGVAFIAMELLEGRTLRALLGGRALPIREALNIGVQVAEGLARAHQAKVIHRDLKPENVIVSSDQHARILDFGLAKLAQEQAETTLTDFGASGMDTISDEVTRAGKVLGTATYMSPEQAQGKPVDTRSDLFSFGIVLYEMATGRVPFKGPGSADTLKAIAFQQAAPPSAINMEVSAELDRIVDKCLEKEPADRYQDGRDLVVDLRRLKRDTESMAVQRVKRSAARRGVPASRWVVASAAVILTLGVALGLRLGWFVSDSPLRLRSMRERHLTSNPVENALIDAAISPDGKYLAFVDPTGVYLRLVDGAELRPLSLPEGFLIEEIEWSPDGTKLLLVRSPDKPGSPNSLYTISPLGGNPRKLLEEVSDISMSPGGEWIAFLSDPFGVEKAPEVWLVRPGGEDSHLVFRGKREEMLFTQVAWSPDGKRVAFGRTARSDREEFIETRDLNGENDTVVVSDTRLGRPSGGTSPLCWLPDGRIVFSLKSDPGADLWAVRTDVKAGKIIGEPSMLAPGNGYYYAHLKATQDGSRLSVLRMRIQRDVQVAEFEQGGSRLHAPRRLTLDDLNDRNPAWTWDSKSILFDSLRFGSYDIFVQDIDGLLAEAIVTGPERQTDPVVSPDGAFVLYWSETPGFDKKTSRRLMRAPLSGGPPEQVLIGDSSSEVRCTPPPSSRCVLGEMREQRMTFSALDPVRGKSSELGRIEMEISYPVWALSADGSRIALVAQTGTLRVLSILDGSLTDFQPEALKDMLYPESLAWSPEGDGLIISGLHDDGLARMFHVDFDRPARLLWNPPMSTIWIGDIAPSPDGRFIAFNVMTGECNAELLEDF